MFTALLAWIPVIGPVINGIVSIYAKSKDAKVAMYKVDGTVDVAAMQASTELVEATQADILVKAARDAILLFGSAWTCLVIWDTIWAEHDSSMMWHTAGFDKTSVPYLPYVFITFLLGNIGLNIWRRK